MMTRFADSGLISGRMEFSVTTGGGSSAGPSFLQLALTTAMGVAGGAMLFRGIERLLGYGGSSFTHAGWPVDPGYGGGMDVDRDDSIAHDHAGADQDLADFSSDPGTDIGVGGSDDGGTSI
jgi:hypothetical protein